MRTKGWRRQLPTQAKFISVWLACWLFGIDSDKPGSFQLVDVLPQAGRRDPVLFCVLLWKNEILPSTALHGHAEIEKPAAGAECVEQLGEEQWVSNLNESFSLLSTLADKAGTIVGPCFRLLKSNSFFRVRIGGWMSHPFVINVENRPCLTTHSRQKKLHSM